MCATPAAMAAPRCEASVGAHPAGGLPDRDLVLLVEDNDVVAELITRILERRGRLLIRARDAAEAERQFMAYAPRIALLMLDCKLPDVHGGVLCQRLRRLVPGLPALFTSGQD